MYQSSNSRANGEGGEENYAGAAMTQSYRNVGVTSVKQNHSMNQQMLNNQTTHYEKMRNSYQVPAKFQ